MIHHATLEVSFDNVPNEFKFWDALGYRRIGNPDQHSVIHWVQARDGSQVHLYPKHKSRIAISEFGHIAIRPYDLLNVLDNLVELPFPVVQDEGSRYWGARRVFVFSPTGHRVELMEFAPQECEAE